MSKYSDYCSKKAAEHGEKFSADELNSAFIEAFNNGSQYRVLVDFGYGEKPTWGYVGVTTGWKPCFLLMRRRGQYGSTETINSAAKIVSSKWLKF